jgi:hypothetical protein
LHRLWTILTRIKRANKKKRENALKFARLFVNLTSSFRK